MEQCLFCDIVAGRAPARRIHEDEHTLAFLDIHPVALGHSLVITKKHVRLLTDIAPGDGLAGPFLKTVYGVSRKLKNGLGCDYVSLLLRGLRVPHIHMHLVPGYENQENLLSVLMRAVDYCQPRLKPELTASELDRLAGRIRQAPAG